MTSTSSPPKGLVTKLRQVIQEGAIKEQGVHGVPCIRAVLGLGFGV